MKENLIEQFLPTQEGTAEDVLEFTGENVPLTLLGEGGLLKRGLQALTGGLAKKGAKEAELPEWAQEIVGAAGMVGPSMVKGGLSKALRPSSKQKEVYDFLKSKGLSDKQITPIIQNEKKLSALSRPAMKYNKKPEWLKGIQNKLGEIYEDIRGKGQNENYLKGEKLTDFENKFYKTLDKLPKRHTRLIKSEVEDLFNQPINFTSLRDFNAAINDVIKGTEGGKASIGKFKEATHEAQKALDPALYKELRDTDKVYSKLRNYTERMTKKNWEGLLTLGHSGHILWGMLTLNPGVLTKAGMLLGGRYTLREMLSNPRLQNIHSKMWDAFLKNKTSQALKLADLFKKEIQIESSSPEAEYRLPQEQL